VPADPTVPRRFLTTKEAASYCGFRTTGGIRKAVLEGRLASAGTYTEEAPNSLTPEKVPEFLGLLRRYWPQHYAIVYVGFITGLRPSMLRPLRRRGPESDIRRQESRMLVRRFETVGQAMECTKTGIRYSVHLPAEALDVLKWHVDIQLNEVQEKSDLLFPRRVAIARTRPLRTRFGTW